MKTRALASARPSGRVPATGCHGKATADNARQRRMARLHHFTVELERHRATDILPMPSARTASKKGPLHDRAHTHLAIA